MKISILTATYNREDKLDKLYKSLINNKEDNVELEWLIMDDGSTDNTEKLISEYIKQEKINIQYYKQKNMGKMVALNNLIKYATGDLVIECDSDDYLANNAIGIIKEEYEKIENDKEIYAMVFLKYNQDLCNIGNNFKDENKKTTMFDLYYKLGLTGDKALVFKTNIRKKYNYKLEENEKFSTEARMHHEMDKNYKVICFNKPIMICEYLENGYSSNIKKVFIQNPYGHYEYFKEMFEMNMKNILFSKRLYIIKHYLLFCYLTKQKNVLKNVKGIFNKIITLILWGPSIVKTKIWLLEK